MAKFINNFLSSTFLCRTVIFAMMAVAPVMASPPQIGGVVIGDKPLPRLPKYDFKVSCNFSATDPCPGATWDGTKLTVGNRLDEQSYKKIWLQITYDMSVLEWQPGDLGLLPPVENPPPIVSAPNGFNTQLNQVSWRKSDSNIGVMEFRFQINPQPAEEYLFPGNIPGFIPDKVFPGLSMSVDFPLSTMRTIEFETFCTPVPEPASWVLLISGFGCTGAAMRRRRIALDA